MHSHDLISVSVGEIRPNGEGNLSLILQAAAGEILPTYSAGAHIDIIIPGIGPRQYSLCGMPDRGNGYEVCIRLTDTSTGGSRYLHQQLKAGDRLAISPPRNHFPAGGRALPAVCRRYRHHAVAGDGRSDCRQKGGLELHYYVASARQTAFSPRLTQLAAGGTVAIHCSEEGASFRQRIPACLTTPDPDTAVVACGPEGFIQRLQSVMEEYRWSPSQFVFERFTPATENNTAAKNAFYIELASSGQRLQVAADQTIAQVLQHAGVEVMLSCEQGMCGSCITGVLDGIPEHRDSVLTAEEKAGNDQITLCCSRAKSPGLVLDL